MYTIDLSDPGLAPKKVEVPDEDGVRTALAEEAERRNCTLALVSEGTASARKVVQVFERGLAERTWYACRPGAPLAHLATTTTRPDRCA